MASKKVGQVIREARTEAGLTQAKLAARVSGVSAADIGRVERGEANLTNEQLKRVAKALGITQASLLNAPKNSAAAGGTGGGTLQLTAAEKRLVQAYRKAPSDAQKAALELLAGRTDGIASTLGDVLEDVLGGLLQK